MNRLILLGLHVISLICLGFGLVLNLLKINITASFFIEFNLFNESRSVLGTLKSLWESANYFPFLLIFIFGILVPLLKSVIIFYILFKQNIHSKWKTILSAISKWAMADVFAISIFIAFLGARAMRNTTAVLEPGFYLFSIYVLLSGLIVTFLTVIPQLRPSYKL